jgi:hypothetical protein
MRHAWHVWLCGLCAGAPTEPCQSLVANMVPTQHSASLGHLPCPHSDPPNPPTRCTAAVYRGMWRGRVVAVKLIECTRPASGGSPAASSGSAVEAALAEAQLSKSLDHPSIVKVRFGGGGGG